MTAMMRTGVMADRRLEGLAARAARAATTAKTGMRGLLRPFRQRFSRRRWLLAVPALTLLGLLVVREVSFGPAMLALMAVAASIAIWPGEDDAELGDGGTGGFEAGSRGAGGDGGWRAVVDAIPEPAIALDAAGNVLHHNAILDELFPNIRRGKAVSHFTRNPELIEAIERASISAEPVVVQFFLRVPVERRVSATVSRLSRSTQDGRALPSLLVTFRDLTDQDKLAQMRADFIANASHELRTPLASLRGFVETLQGPARDDPAARERFLGIMASQASRMTRLIDDLLSLSRVEMRVHLPPRGVADLNEVAAYVIQTLEPLAKASGTTVSLARLDGLARVRGDREELVQVLQNLIQNAIKYGQQGGTVDVRVMREPASANSPARIMVAVEDDGIGIAPEHLPRLTERFYRVNVAKSRDKGGTGLGLAIVKHIINRHRGDLRITSIAGEGSTFTVILDEMAGARSPGQQY